MTDGPQSPTAPRSILFTVIGVLTHGSSVAALARDLLVFLGCWFAAALALRLYAARELDAAYSRRG